MPAACRRTSRVQSAMAQAARKLVRVLPQAHPGRGNADAAKQFGGAVECPRARHTAMTFQDLGHLRADRVAARHDHESHDATMATTVAAMAVVAFQPITCSRLGSVHRP
jgi:hypothetical protein